MSLVFSYEICTLAWKCDRTIDSLPYASANGMSSIDEASTKMSAALEPLRETKANYTARIYMHIGGSSKTFEKQMCLNVFDTNPM